MNSDLVYTAAVSCEVQCRDGLVLLYYVLCFSLFLLLPELRFRDLNPVLG